MDRIVNAVGRQTRSFELVKVALSKAKQEIDCSYGLYTHPSGLKNWRPCRILEG